MSKKLVSVILCICIIFSLSAINAFADNTDMVSFKTISGVISLPEGIVAPAGGLNVYTEILTDNGTPNDWHDDIHGGMDVLIHEGQNQAAYSIQALESASGYRVMVSAKGYVLTFYRQQGGTADYNQADLVSVNDGSRADINMTLMEGVTISGTVSLPSGELAPAGGIGISFSVYSENGTPNYIEDDVNAPGYAVIPEGQNLTGYEITMSKSNAAYILYYYANGYDSGRYSVENNYLIDLSNGSKNDINIILTQTPKKIISGVIKLPEGDTAPVGGLNVYVEIHSENGTPDDWNDDLYMGTNMVVAEGQSQVPYSIDAPETASGYKVMFRADEYLQTFYTLQGGTNNYGLAELVDIKDGNKTNVDITLIKGRNISGTVSLPSGEAAPEGGVNVTIYADLDNGTQNDWSDDINICGYAFIQEGQNQAGYTLSVQNSNSGYQIQFNAENYVPVNYSSKGSVIVGGDLELVYVSDGDKGDINGTLIHGNTIAGLINLPEGQVAPQGGVEGFISLCNKFSDGHICGYSVKYFKIPEGQNSVEYSETRANNETIIGYSLLTDMSSYSRNLREGFIGADGMVDTPDKAKVFNFSQDNTNDIKISIISGKQLNLTAINGAVVKSSEKSLYYDGELVNLTAIPNEGYKFAGWSGDISGNNPTVTVIMDSDKTITATFTPVIKESVRKIEVINDQKSIKLKPGDQRKIELRVIYKNGYSENLQNAEWKSSDERIVTVKNGVITAVEAGKAKVTASYMGKDVTIIVDTRH
jgi:uncharacterized repeat protein (TIGR02543 family)